MAANIKLVRDDDWVADVASLRLDDFSASIGLVEQGWAEGVADAADQSVPEVLSLLIRGTTHDAVASVFQTLADWVRLVKEYYQSVIEAYPVWLRVQTQTESQSRQAVIMEARLDRLDAWHAGYKQKATDGYYYLPVRLALTRAPYWEDDGLDAVTASQAAVSCIGGAAAYTSAYGGATYTLYSAVPGDVLARLAALNFVPESGMGALKKFWLGFRDDRFGSPALFVPAWSLRLASTFGTDTTGGTSNPSVNDPSASDAAKDGYKAVASFGTVATLTPRVTIMVQDVTGDYEEQRGTFLVLLRAKLTNDTSVVRVRLADGLSGSSSFRTRQRVVLSGSDSDLWNYYELGTVSIPNPGRTLFGLDYTRRYALRIDAERVSGAASLEMDCLVLIPQDDGLVFVDDGNLSYAAGRSLLVFGRADGFVYSLGMADFFGSMYVEKVGTPSIQGGCHPGSGKVFLAGQRSDRTFKTDTVTLGLMTIPRWRGLRGND